MKRLSLTVAIASLIIPSGHARTWTSADGAKTFEGDLRDYDSERKTVTVIVGGKALTFTEDKLSAEDVAFLKENAATPSSEEASQAMAETEVGKKVTKAKLHKIEGDRYKRAELDKAPEYYLLYYSASW